MLLNHGISAQNEGKYVSATSIFQNFLGEHATRAPRKVSPVVSQMMALPSKIVPFANKTWVKGGNMRVKCLAQEQNTVLWPGLKLGLLKYPESRAFPIGPLFLPLTHRSNLNIIKKQHSFVKFLPTQTQHNLLRCFHQVQYLAHPQGMLQCC